ncbi:MAG: glycoside hydrolase family 3 C-terminal domain-containing protein, partial [Gammaproteobacteria bacterium]|nr:glycoside hydrolase family 3 C-terminal domain-containing protein [Gammaproteobacteria bacterium]
SGGWTITWQGTGNNNADFPGGSSIYAGIQSQVSAAGGQVQLSSDGSYQQKPDVAIVVFGEQPYAEGNGDIDNLEYQRGNKADLALLKKLQADGIKVVSLFISGRPLWVNAELNASDAFVAIWLPGSEGHAIAPVLFTDKDGKVQQDFRGKLSFSWPNSPSQTTVNQGDDNYQPLFAYGYGLTYTNTPEQAASLFGAPLNESSNADNGLTALPLFDRDIKAPWQFVLQSAEQSAAVSSNQQQLGAVKLQSFDRKVQEDARLISFDGTQPASVALRSNFPRDLRAFGGKDAVLSLLLKVDSAVTAPVELAMHCNEQCSASLDISPQLQQFKTGVWTELQVDVRCFTNKGLDLGQVAVPLALSSASALQLSFAELRLLPQGSADAVKLQCPES